MRLLKNMRLISMCAYQPDFMVYDCLARVRNNQLDERYCIVPVNTSGNQRVKLL